MISLKWLFLSFFCLLTHGKRHWRHTKIFQLCTQGLKLCSVHPRDPGVVTVYPGDPGVVTVHPGVETAQPGSGAVYRPGLGAIASIHSWIRVMSHFLTFGAQLQTLGGQLQILGAQNLVPHHQDLPLHFWYTFFLASSSQGGILSPTEARE